MSEDVHVAPERRERRFGVHPYFALILAGQERLARLGRLCNPRRGLCGKRRSRPATIRLIVQDVDVKTGRSVGDPYEVVVCKDHRKWWNMPGHLILREERLPPIEISLPPRRDVDGYTGHDVRRGLFFECNNGAGFGIGDEDADPCELEPEYMILVAWADPKNSRQARKGAATWLSTVCGIDLERWKRSGKVVVLDYEVLDERAARLVTGAAA